MSNLAKLQIPGAGDEGKVPAYDESGDSWYLANLYGAELNSQSASYTLVDDDRGKVVEISNASANTLTVPPNASVAFPVGTIVEVRQMGAGQTTLTPGSGVTLRSRGSALKIAGQYGSATLHKRATNEWVVAGDVTT